MRPITRGGESDPTSVWRPRWVDVVEAEGEPRQAVAGNVVNPYACVRAIDPKRQEPPVGREARLPERTRRVDQGFQSTLAVDPHDEVFFAPRASRGVDQRAASSDTELGRSERQRAGHTIENGNGRTLYLERGRVEAHGKERVAVRIHEVSGGAVSRIGPSLQKDLIFSRFERMHSYGTVVERLDVAGGEREENRVRSRKDFRKPVALLAAIRRRGRQYFDITSLGRDARETDVVAWSKNDPVVIAPARSTDVPASLGDGNECPAGDSNLHELATQVKSQPSTVRREKGHRRALGAIDELRIHLVQSAQKQLSRVVARCY